MSDFELARERMVENQVISRGIADDLVIAALREVPRHLFVPESLKDKAYIDGPLPIGEGQTISQPYVVAHMTELLGLEGGEKILDIGTGSGYQAAILAEIAEEVHSVERVDSLLRETAIRLAALGYENIHLHKGDGWQGLPHKAPFDGILVGAAAPTVPKALMEQLAGEWGRMVIPVGGDEYQQLLLIERQGNDFKTTIKGEVRFVPLLRGI